MGRVITHAILLHELEWMRQELTALREERALLLRDLAAARDRGDQAVNALLAVKGERPFVASPPPPSPDRDLFEEDVDQRQAMQDLIRQQGVEAAFYAH